MHRPSARALPPITRPWRSGAIGREQFRGLLAQTRELYRIPEPVGVALIVLPWIVAIVLCYLILYGSTHALGDRLVQENGWVENLTVAADIPAGILALLLAHRARRAGHKTLGLYFNLVGAFFLVFACEELDWGQRIFHWKTPGPFADVNLHQAMNLHNMPILEYLEYPVILTMSLVGIAAAWLSGNSKLRGFSTPPILISLLLVIGILALVCLRVFVNPAPATPLDLDLYDIEEIMEMLLGFAGLLYVWLNGRMLGPQWSGTRSDA